MPLSCGGSGGDAPDGTVTDAGPTDSQPSDAPLPDGGGAGTVSGSVDGTPFTTVTTSYLIGAPDSAETTVVFVFSKPVKCSDLATPGWDQRIADGTQLLEMKIFGKDPGAFKAVTTVTPAPGEASVNYTLSSTAGTPKETGSSGGSVTLEALAASTSAQGRFSLQFGASKLDGTFDAVFCPGGHEP
ncbi:MAG: hypothetical protein JWM74_990 [Myxococcaceae bacterium]|nr:hypothetical protein [Myxococcaceae bacterium]